MARDGSLAGAMSRSGADVCDDGVRFFAALAVGRLAALLVTFFRTVFFVALAFVRFFAIDLS
jgi:hypothetical protein